MFNASRLAQLILCVLLSSAASADDANLPDTGRGSLPVTTPSLETLLAESEYGRRWRLVHPVETGTYTENWTRPITSLRFEHTSTISRLGKLRNLALLTLAETRRTRLFVGVNADGLVGVHFYVVNPSDDERYVELVRMPYLEGDEPNGGAASLRSKSK